MDSFYGGLNGQSFSIKTLFTTYYALQADLSKGWSSPVSVGEFVVVSYGMPQDEGYDAYKQVDIGMYNMTYNSTLWQKTYDESANGNANGLSYKLIASMTGSTPTIGLADTIVLDADKDPTVAVDKTDIDSYEFTFSLPQSQILHLGDTQIVSCTYEPEIDWDESDINDPVITFTLPRSQAILEAIATSINAGETPTVRLDIGLNSGDTGTVDRPVLRFELPVSQTWHQGSITVLDADEDPYFTITSDPSDVNKKILSFALPQSQILNLGTTLVVDADVSPSVDLDDSDINNPTITFSLPQAQILQLGTTTVANANIKPSVKLDNTDINKPVISFTLPQAQVMGQPTTTVVDSTVEPSVGLNADNVNAPYLTFILPRATHIQVGVLDEDSQTEGLELPDESQPLTDENGNELTTEDGQVLYSYVAGTLEEGDYFLNGDSGYLYKVVDGKLYFQCSLQVPKPTIGTTKAIDPYKLSGSSYVMNSPSVTMTETSTGWTLTFSLPTAPDFAATVNSIGVEATASVSTKIIDTNTVEIDFNLPRGANIYAGTDVNEYHTTTSVTGALVGDLYINTDTGYIFKLNSSGTWVQQDGSIQGPAGDTLNFAADYTLIETSTYENTDENSFKYIEDNYEGTISSNDIFTVTWIDTEGVDWAYWCYQVDGEWNRVQLTGGVASLIVSTKTDNQNKAYSTTYINSLIGLTYADGEDTSTKTYSADQIDNLLDTASSETEALLSWGSFTDLT